MASTPLLTREQAIMLREVSVVNKRVALKNTITSFMECTPTPKSAYESLVKRIQSSPEEKVFRAALLTFASDCSNSLVGEAKVTLCGTAIAATPTTVRFKSFQEALTEALLAKYKPYFPDCVVEMYESGSYNTMVSLVLYMDPK